jgi:hypothetical protein
MQHAVLVMKNALYLFGGRTGLVNDKTNNPYLNDLWSSPDGVNWKLEMKHCQWGPRGSFAAGVIDDEQLVIAFGQNDTGAVDEVWSSKGLKPWIKDFSWGETVQQYYIDKLRPLKYVHVITPENIELMKKVDIYTIEDFATVSFVPCLFFLLFIYHV